MTSFMILLLTLTIPNALYIFEDNNITNKLKTSMLFYNYITILQPLYNKKKIILKHILHNIRFLGIHNVLYLYMMKES